jgi:hypothetical protein
MAIDHVVNAAEIKIAPIFFDLPTAARVLAYVGPYLDEYAELYETAHDLTKLSDKEKKTLPEDQKIKLHRYESLERQITQPNVSIAYHEIVKTPIVLIQTLVNHDRAFFIGYPGEREIKEWTSDPKKLESHLIENLHPSPDGHFYTTSQPLRTEHFV